MSMTPHGVVELWNEVKTSTFLVNSQRVKHYYGDDVERKEEVIELVDK